MVQFKLIFGDGPFEIIPTLFLQNDENGCHIAPKYWKFTSQHEQFLQYFCGAKFRCVFLCRKADLESKWNQQILVGGLEPWNFMTFPSYWEFHHPNWLSLHHFSEGWRKTTRIMWIFARNLIHWGEMLAAVAQMLHDWVLSDVCSHWPWDIAGFLRHQMRRCMNCKWLGSQRASATFFFGEIFGSQVVEE